jgi:transcriptional regulator with XRE-family HTH domain
MTNRQGLKRKAHFLGTKIKSLRKRNNLTLEDLSVRCIQIDAEAGPSVSYLSMIENGKRVPSERLLQIVAEIFQKDVNWFYDESLDSPAIDPAPLESAVSGIPLEPGFLFSENLLQLAIPELLAQTGTTGRQFAHLLIRAHQESNRNRFPDIERAAETVGRKRFPLDVEDVFDIANELALEVRWFDKSPFKDRGDTDAPLNMIVRSFYDAPNIIYLNNSLRDTPSRLKYDLANHIAHKVLHDGDGARAPQVSGGRVSGRRHDADSPNVDAQDILFAWRDFECSYFAAALLAPKTPFRQFLARHAHAALALLRCIPARQSARRVPRQRHPPALGQHDHGLRPLPALGRVPDVEHALDQTVFTDFGAAFRGRQAPLLLPVDSQQRRGR